MDIVSHKNGSFGGSRDGGGGWYACWTKPEELVACQEMPEHFLSARRYTDDTRSLRLLGALFLACSSRNLSVCLKRPYHGTLREASGSLSMQPVVCTSWCSMDTAVVCEL